MSTRPFSSKEPQERCKTVHVAMNAVRNKNGTICHHDHGIGRNKGRVPAVLMADSARALHIRPWLHTSNDDGLNGVRGGECWPHPNDMHTDEHRPQRQTLDRISRTCTRRVARREACSVRAAHPLLSARRRRAPRWATPAALRLLRQAMARRARSTSFIKVDAFFWPQQPVHSEPTFP